MIVSLIGLIVVCAALAAIVWLSAYGCMRMSNETITVKPICSANDWFE